MPRKPESMEECVYFTQRSVGDGEVMVWVFRKECPKCGTLMGKPRNKKGKVLTRAKVFICPKCNFSVDEKEYEESLMANIEYTCPSCKFSGEMQIPFKRKNIDGVETLRFQCQKCNSNIDIKKKMKEKKGK